MTDADHKFLVDYLRDRDETCPACKYNLRNLTGVRCPECGEELQLRVSPVEPRQAAPISGLVGVSMGLGLNALLLVYAAIEVGKAGRVDRFMYPFVVYNTVGGFVHVVALGGWIAGWRRIRRWSLKWILVALAWLLSFANVIGFSMVIR
jgi:predicted RNA-binding Zn-ribbon protein involved in translation (DUF1610 family)